MSNDIIKTSVTLMMVMYSFFVIAICMMGGAFDNSWFIDGEEIKDVCDVLSAIVTDDDRGDLAIGTLILIMPVVIYNAFNKFRLISINICLLAFVLCWLWFFIIEYRNCLWF